MALNFVSKRLPKSIIPVLAGSDITTLNWNKKISVHERQIHVSSMVTNYYHHYNPFLAHQSTKRMIPHRLSLERRFSTGVVIGSLVFTNVSIYMLWKVANRQLMKENFTLHVGHLKRLRFHTLITNAFSHTRGGHIFFNMLSLYLFGNHLGLLYGPGFLLKLYLGGAFGGSLFVLVHQLYLTSTSKDKDLQIDVQHGASCAVMAITLVDLFSITPESIWLQILSRFVGIYLVGHEVLVLKKHGEIPASGHLGGAAVAVICWVGLKNGCSLM